MNREQELQKLIEEQRHDMSLGQVQEPEPNTVPLGEWVRHLSNEGMTPRVSRIFSGDWTCVLHGDEDIVPAPESWLEVNGRRWRCRVCTREQQRLYYLTHKPQMHAANAAYQKKRYANDPAFREKRKEYNRRAREKRRAAND